MAMKPNPGSAQCLRHARTLCTAALAATMGGTAL